jgi:hypothetical protein
MGFESIGVFPSILEITRLEDFRKNANLRTFSASGRCHPEAKQASEGVQMFKSIRTPLGITRAPITPILVPTLGGGSAGLLPTIQDGKARAASHGCGG